MRGKHDERLVFSNQLTTFDESKPLNRAEGRIEDCGYSGGEKRT